jgi:predicted glycosyltransferase
MTPPLKGNEMISHHPTVELVVESPTLLLTKRIRVLINTTGLSREECHEVIMSVKNPPTVEEFHLAYSAAVILTR